MNYEEIISNILSRRDPQGYYIIPVSKSALRDVLSGFGAGNIIVDDYGDSVFIKTKSRRVAKKIIARALRLNALFLNS